MTDTAKQHDTIEAIQNEIYDALAVNGVFHSPHEGYAVLLEEVDELWAEITPKPHLRDRKKIYKEAVQVAAMAARIAIEFGDDA